MRGLIHILFIARCQLLAAGIHRERGRMDKIEQKEKMLELNRFLQLKADEGLSAESVKV